MVRLTRNCDICKSRGVSVIAIADVKLNESFGGSWGYVCSVHYSLRMSDNFVTRLEPENG